MNHRTDRRDILREIGNGPPRGDRESRLVFGLFWGILCIGSFLVTCPWAGFHGVLLACAGLLIGLFPPQVSLPRHWWLLAAAFVICGSAAFLPADWFAMPAWRGRLRELGVETGSKVAIQARQAVEMLLIFAIMSLTGLWLAGHRASPSQLRVWALAFVVGVACYSIAARAMQISLHGKPGVADGHFGFFPNRNHSATYLAMGAICGLGCVVQAIRDKRFVAMSLALAATGVCLWAVAAWSISRAGVVLVAIACLVWLPVMGRRYLGRHGLWAVGLMALTAVGLFFIADSGVKERLAKTVEKAGTVIRSDEPLGAGEGKSERGTAADLDFRIPTALDTLDLIRDFKWTGIGAGQFRYVFPQYRNHTAVANDVISYHPESDWLWLASETGVPASLALAALVVLVSMKSLKSILKGRHRALRGACLAAALIVPIHGIFDVPGHRITLAWSSAFLFALSLPPISSDGNPGNPARWPFRLAGVCICACAAFLIGSQWLGGPPPAVLVGEIAHRKAMDLYDEDQRRLKAAETAGLDYHPAPNEDLLEQALGNLAEATRLAPLDSRLRHVQGFIALHFEDLLVESARAFEIEAALNPTSVKVPLLQGQAWSRADPERAASLWRAALARARNLDARNSGPARFTGHTYSEILGMARGNARLESLVEGLAPD